MVVISIFSIPTANKSKFENAKTYLEKRGGVMLEQITARQYESMSGQRKFEWGVLESYLTWVEGGAVMRYVGVDL
jgi:hypothetical protein